MNQEEEKKSLTEEVEEEDSRQLTLECYSQVRELWKEEWRDMPEYIHENLEPWKTVYVHFESREAMNNFSEIINQQITTRTRSLWYPEAEIGRFSNKEYIDES